MNDFTADGPAQLLSVSDFSSVGYSSPQTISDLSEAATAYGYCRRYGLLASCDSSVHSSAGANLSIATAGLSLLGDNGWEQVTAAMVDFVPPITDSLAGDMLIEGGYQLEGAAGEDIWLTGITGFIRNDAVIVLQTPDGQFAHVFGSRSTSRSWQLFGVAFLMEASAANQFDISLTLSTWDK